MFLLLYLNDLSKVNNNHKIIMIEDLKQILASINTYAILSKILPILNSFMDEGAS